jgi:hypothetical protein
MSNPKKWINVYPQGTKEGDQEQKFFIALARHPKYDFRSVSALSKESGLNENRVEEIIQKYYDKGMIFQNPKNEDQWGYWERCTELLNADDTSISKQDKDDRIDEASADGIWYSSTGDKPDENVIVCDWTTELEPETHRKLCEGGEVFDEMAKWDRWNFCGCDDFEEADFYVPDMVDKVMASIKEIEDSIEPDPLIAF